MDVCVKARNGPLVFHITPTKPEKLEVEREPPLFHLFHDVGVQLEARPMMDLMI